MMLVGVPGKRKASPQLRNVVCNRKLAWCAYVLLSWKDDGFHSVQSIPSQIGEKPGVKRNHFQKVSENFSKRPGLFAHLYYTVKSATTAKIWQKCKIRPFHSEKLQKCKMKSERAKRVLIRSKTTQTTKPHRKFFVLILERADGQNVRHHHAENQKCRMHTWFWRNVADICRSRFSQTNTIVLPSILWAKSKKTGYWHDSPISKNMTPPLGYTSSDNLSLEVVRILVSPPPIAPSFTTNEQAAMLY